MNELISIAYIVSSILFIIGIKRLGKVTTARQGNFLSSLGMFIAICATLFKMQIIPINWILLGIIIGAIIGTISAFKVAMTSMPEMVAIFNGFGGGASALVASAELFKFINNKEIYLIELAKNNGNINIILITIILSIIIGSLTFTGSFIAWGKYRPQKELK